MVPFENPAEIVDKSADPRLGALIALDLGRRGIRSMEYSPTEQVYYVMDGAAGTGGNFELYRWSGTAGEPPTVSGAGIAAFGDPPRFTPGPGNYRDGWHTNNPEQVKEYEKARRLKSSLETALNES